MKPSRRCLPNGRALTSPRPARTGRVFTSLYGTPEDLLNDGYRRMLVNGCFWALGLEDAIKPDANIAFVGPFKPNTFGNGSHARGIKPEMYAGFESPIPANNNTQNPNAPGRKKNESKKARRTDRSAKTARTGCRAERLACCGVGHRQARAVRPHRTAGRQTHPHARGSGSDQRRQEHRAEREGDSVEHQRRRRSRRRRSMATRIPTTASKGRRTRRTQVKRIRGGNSISDRRMDVEKIGIWNRSGFESRLDGFTLTLLDADRKEVFRATGVAAPQAMEIDVKNGGKLSYLTYDGKPGAPVAGGASLAKDGDKKRAESRQPIAAGTRSGRRAGRLSRSAAVRIPERGCRRHSRQRSGGSHAARRLDGDAAAKPTGRPAGSLPQHERQRRPAEQLPAQLRADVDDRVSAAGEA